MCSSDLAAEGASVQQGTRSTSYWQKPKLNTNFPAKRITTHRASVSSPMSCPICRSQHQVYKCHKFLAMTVSKRNQAVKETSLCFNCLKPGHNVQSCSSQSKCKVCGEGHNSLLHRAEQLIERSEGASSTVISNHSVATSIGRQVLLATAIVDARD